MASFVYKLAGMCDDGFGSHGTITVSGDGAGTFSLGVEEFRETLDTINAMGQKRKAVLLLALHASLNNLNLAQLKAEVVSASGAPITI